MIRSILVLLLSASSLHAQLMLTAEHVPASTVVRVNRGQYKHASVIAERLPDLAEIDLLRGDNENEYRFPPEAPRGKYRVVVNAFDAELGVGRKSLFVTLSDAPPTPDEPTDPTDPDEPEALTPLAKDARAAIRQLIRDMAANMDEVAKRAAEGRYQSVLEAANDGVLLDLESRNKFKAAMAAAMKNRLGDNALPADSPQVFVEIATGFRGVK